MYMLRMCWNIFYFSSSSSSLYFFDLNWLHKIISGTFENESQLKDTRGEELLTQKSIKEARSLRNIVSSLVSFLKQEVYISVSVKEGALFKDSTGSLQNIHEWLFQVNVSLYLPLPLLPIYFLFSVSSSSSCFFFSF